MLFLASQRSGRAGVEEVGNILPMQTEKMFSRLVQIQYAFNRFVEENPVS